MGLAAERYLASQRLVGWTIAIDTSLCGQSRRAGRLPNSLFPTSLRDGCLPNPLQENAGSTNVRAWKKLRSTISNNYNSIVSKSSLAPPYELPLDGQLTLCPFHQLERSASEQRALCGCFVRYQRRYC